MVAELNKLKKAGTKLDFSNISTDSFEISKLSNTTFATHWKSTNRINHKSKSNKAKRNLDEKKKNFIPDYKILKMLSKDDIAHNTQPSLVKNVLKNGINKIKPNASNYVSKVVNSKSKANYSTAIENLVNQAFKTQSLNGTSNADGIRIRRKVKEKSSLL